MGPGSLKLIGSCTADAGSLWKGRVVFPPSKGTNALGLEAGSVPSVELDCSGLSIRWDNRKIGLQLHEWEVGAVLGFLRFKVAERLTLKA